MIEYNIVSLELNLYYASKFPNDFKLPTKISKQKVQVSEVIDNISVSEGPLECVFCFKKCHQEFLWANTTSSISLT